MSLLSWTLIAFLSGSIPYSLLIGRLAGAPDIRQYGDHNPGAFNVLRALGARWFTLAMLLDGFKGAIPVGLAWYAGRLNDWSIVPVALAPIFGHAYSPWLRLRGGKAVAVTFGVWAGLSLGTGPVVLGCLLGLFYALLDDSGWAILLAFGVFGIFVLAYYGALFPQWVAVWALNWALFAWKHRQYFRQLPAFSDRIKRRLERKDR